MNSCCNRPKCRSPESVLVPAFAPFEGFSAGGFVSVGDFQRSGRVQFVVTPDRAGGPRVSIYELVPGSGIVRRANYFSLDSNFRGGIRTAVGDLNGDGTDRGGVRVAATNADGDTRADVIVGTGEGRAARARAYLGRNYGGGEPTAFQDLEVFNNAVVAAGIFVG